MTRKRGKAAVIDALITSGGFGDFGIRTNASLADGRPQGATPVRARAETSTEETQNARGSQPLQTDSQVKAPEIFEPVAQPSNQTLARERNDIGPVQQIHQQVPVVESIEDIPDLSQGMIRLFIPCSLVKPWDLHDRRLIGEPEVADIYESILTEGQEEPCVTRLSPNGKDIELIAGYRRFYSVQNTSTGYLLIDLYDSAHLSDRTAWIEMTRENNLDRKKSIPISVQVESDRKALAQGLFKNLSELSKAAGKSENWARQNRHLVEQIPEAIRALCSQQRLSSLTAPHYRKIGKLFKSGNQWRTDRIQSVVEHWDTLSAATDRFPMKQIEELLQSRGADVKALSSSSVRVRVDHNGNINLTVSKGLSHQQISALVKTVQNTIETL